ncbi:hypothetical protein LJR231_003263 [Phyllobacterium sp. LjRoot231]|uniref:hypothetical protein n=1 Tax=Phyllobacterium sp. LjRoot231 TaxID=3342289 RepID=UPI003ECE1497
MPRHTVKLMNGATIEVSDDLEHERIGPMLAREGYWTTNLFGRHRETKITLMLHGVATIEQNFDVATEIANQIADEDGD